MKNKVASLEEFDNEKQKRGDDRYADEPVSLGDLMSEVAPYAFDEDKAKSKRKRKPKPRSLKFRFLLIILILLVLGLGIISSSLITGVGSPRKYPTDEPLNYILAELVVKSDKLPLHIKPDADSPIIDYLPKGSRITAMAQWRGDKRVGRWFYLKSSRGWVSETDPVKMEDVLWGYQEDQANKDINQLTLAIKQDETNGDNYFYRGWAYYGKKDYQAAVADLSKAIELKPDSTELYGYRGQVYYDMGEYTNAFNDFDEVIRRGNLTSSAYYHRALASIDLKLRDAAVTDLKKAIQLSPGYGLLYNDLGMIYYEQDNTEEAQSNFDRAIEIDPQLNIAYRNRATLARDKGDPQQTALNDYNLALNIDRMDETTIVNRGIYYGMHGDFDLAMADYNSAIRYNPTYALAYAEIGVEYINAMRDQEALPNILKALSLDPNLDIAQGALGMYYYHTGDYEKSFEMFKKVYETNASFPNITRLLNNAESAAQFTLGMQYYQLSDFENALKAFNKVYDINPFFTGLEEMITKTKSALGQ